MVTVRSVTTDSLISSGNSDRRPGICAWIASTVATMLASGWRVMMIGTAFLPLNSPIVRTSSGASSTVPMSINRTGAPLRQAMMVGAKSLAVTAGSLL